MQRTQVICMSKQVNITLAYSRYTQVLTHLFSLVYHTIFSSFKPDYKAVLTFSPYLNLNQQASLPVLVTRVKHKYGALQHDSFCNRNWVFSMSSQKWFGVVPQCSSTQPYVQTQFKCYTNPEISQCSKLILGILNFVWLRLFYQHICYKTRRGRPR